MDVEALLTQFHADLAAAAEPAALEDVRRAYTGKKSPIKAAFKTLRTLPPDERSQVAAALNEANQTIASALDEAAQHIAAKALSAQLDAEWADLSMPGQTTRRGARHLDGRARVGAEPLARQRLSEPDGARVGLLE
mgnify:CR=1 FL=1